MQKQTLLATGLGAAAGCGVAVLCGAVSLLGTTRVSQAAPLAHVNVDLAASGPKISPMLYGIFYEEINRAGDGGLYAEMLENRSFEDADHLTCWATSGTATLSLDKSLALNNQNPTALKVEVTGSGGASNDGFKDNGLFVQKGQSYNLSFYARSTDATYGPLEARLESRSGTALATAKVASVGQGWKKYTLTLKSNANDTTAKLVINGTRSGTFFLDQVSLMPQATWKNVPLRTDLAQRVATMKPAFVRFPGGCFVEGDRMANSTRWKETIGDPALRPGHWNLWGYRSTDGFGAQEFLQWCEDMGSEPVYVINCGMAHADSTPMTDIQTKVQDALDFIEYARGPVSSKWGAIRALNGHPQPFKLNYMEIGNENGGAKYNERYVLFHDAIKAKYPDMQLIADNPADGSRKLDIVDEHYYSSPSFFREKATMYDSYPRTGPQIYVGEYAVTQGCGKGNMAAALGEAAFMTGLERNADIVKMASYAPLFVRPDWAHWNPNAIVFNQDQSYGTPSYWTQVIFGNNRGDVVVPSKLDAPIVAPDNSDKVGGVGVGTWKTQAEFKDIRVERNGQTLYASDFTNPDGAKGWRYKGGQWQVVDGVLRQSATDENVRAFIGDKSWGSDYTLTLKARKISGDEGFLISFRSPGDDEKRWWNLGGWGNSTNALENGGNDAHLPGHIETGKWYDIKIEAQGDTVKCYLDGNLIVTGAQKPAPQLFSVASKTADGKALILKLVNTSSAPMETAIDLQGAKKIGGTAQMTTLSASDPMAENSFDHPQAIVPKTIQVPVSASFTRTLPANSITILRLRTN